MKRRQFLKNTAILGSAVTTHPLLLFAKHSQHSFGYFQLHPFIEKNPDAVFIAKTNIAAKTDSNAIRNAAQELGATIFLPSQDEQSGIPFSNKIIVKPNLTRRYRERDQYSIEGTMGIVTDAYFLEGLIESIKTLGQAGEQFYIREVHCDEKEWEHGGYWGMAERTGANLKNLDANILDLDPDMVNWVDVPDGGFFTKIPYLWPVNTTDSFLINLAKFKAHGMGLTLCAKNIQGMIAKEYQGHCRSASGFRNKKGISGEHLCSDAESFISQNYNRHKKDGIPRWDKSNDSLDGLRMETWATRCLDNHSVTEIGLNMIEGVYGRDGNFINGPHGANGEIDLDNKNGLAKDYMSNLVIFGKNAFYVDMIGYYLGGHEPGNVGLFHLAQEHGYIDFLNPHDIPLYQWQSDGSAVRQPLDSFDRTELWTYYLQRNHNGQTESYWHLLDEPFDYSNYTKVTGMSDTIPDTYVLQQNFPNPFNDTTSIQFFIPKDSHVRIDVMNTRGQIVDVLTDGYRCRGTHMVAWHTRQLASGHYSYRMVCDNYSTVKKMVLVK